MRASLVAVVALVAAVIGGTVAAAVVQAVGDGSGSVQTVTVEAAPAPTETPVAAPSARAAAPIPAGRFDAAQIYAKRSPGVVTVYALFGDDASIEELHAGSQGSGFVVSRAGHVLTNAHVITSGRRTELRGASRVYLEFEDGDRVRAEVVGWDTFNDVGVLRVRPGAHRLVPVPLGDSTGVVVGEPVAAIGSPFGKQNTLTTGIISATSRSLPSLNADYDLVGAIQTDAAINRGNSGGPLFDARGQVIGINAQIRSNSGVSEGVGFAVPINSAKRSLRHILRTGRVPYAYVGVSTDDLTPALARRFDYAAPYGAVVVCVKEGSPGAKAGLRGGSESEPFNGPPFIEGGDLIVAINGRPVRSGTDLVRIVSESLEPGGVATFTFFRGQERRRVQVQLGERPRSSSRCEP